MFHVYENTEKGQSYSVTCYVVRQGGSEEIMDNEHTVYEKDKKSRKIRLHWEQAVILMEQKVITCSGKKTVWHIQ